MSGFDPFIIFFGFSSITPGFIPFVLFRVLRHRAEIRSLPFVSGSPASCPNSIPSFCFKFSGIAPGFDPFLLLRVLRHGAQIRSLPFVSGSPELCPYFHYLFRHRDLIFFIFLSIVSEHRLSFPASCLTFIIFSVFLIFLGIVSKHCLSFSTSRPYFSYLHWHCVRITHLPRHRAWVSLSPSIVATQFYQPLVLGKGTKFLVI